MADKTPLLLDLVIPYCITPEKYTFRPQAVGSNAEKNAYLEAMMREVRSYEGELEDYEIQAVRLSGGAVTVMKPDLLGELLTLVRKVMPVAPHAEVSFDALPNTVGTPSLTGIAAGHPTRVELMMHSENEAELQTLRCPFHVQDVHNALLYLNRFRMNNVSLSVVYGFPGQTLTSWKKTLNLCARSAAAHITVSCVDDTETDATLTGAEREELFRYACDFLKSEGYQHYGLGLFCQPNHENRYMAGLCSGTAVLGIGAGAVSTMDGYLVRNTNNTNLYIQYAGDFEKTTAEAAILDADTQMKRYLIGRLSLVQGLTEEGFLSRFHTPLPEDLKNRITEFETNGWVEHTEQGVVPTIPGLTHIRDMEKSFL